MNTIFKINAPYGIFCTYRILNIILIHSWFKSVQFKYSPWANLIIIYLLTAWTSCAKSVLHFPPNPFFNPFFICVFIKDTSVSEAENCARSHGCSQGLWSAEKLIPDINAVYTRNKPEGAVVSIRHQVTN